MLDFLSLIFVIISIITTIITGIIVIRLFVNYKKEINEEKIELFSVEDIFKLDPLMDKILLETEKEKLESQNTPLAGRGSIRLGKYNGVVSNEKYKDYKKEILSYKLP